MWASFVIQVAGREMNKDMAILNEDRSPHAWEFYCSGAKIFEWRIIYRRRCDE